MPVLLELSILFLCATSVRLTGFRFTSLSLLRNIAEEYAHTFKTPAIISVANQSKYRKSYIKSQVLTAPAKVRRKLSGIDGTLKV